MTLKTYDTYLEESRQSKNRVREWIIDKVENSDLAHDVMKKMFLKAFPGKGKQFDKIISELVD